MPLTLVLSVGLEPALLGTRNVVLQSAGYIVVSAVSIKEAVNVFQGGDFDLVVLCHSIPTKDRDRLTCLIRASGSRTPVISVSGRTCECDAFADVTLEDGPNKFLAGINDLLIKQPRIPAWTTPDKQEAAAPSGKRAPMSSTDCEQQQERETPASDGNFASLAHSGARAAFG